MARRYRGGLGQVIESDRQRATASPSPRCSTDRIRRAGRVATPAHGGVHLDDGTPLTGKGVHEVPAGDAILELPGGGGFGDPAGRDPAAVAHDHRQGYVAPGPGDEGSAGSTPAT
ncbi:MAG: hypothetical protein R2695_10170 [Acidimicrobiales bacterium]